MNPFETLLAPPSLAPKDLSIHIRMHPEIPKEVSGECRDELRNVAARLRHELATCRFARTLPDEAEPSEYRELVASLTGASATPIPYPFFAGYYLAPITATIRALGEPEDALGAVLGLGDQWAVQAWAAQALRVAVHSEAEDPGNAAAAWRTAVRLYQRFFEMSSVEQTHTYQQQSDASAQGLCRAAWNSFLADEIALLGHRLEGYGKTQQPGAVAAAAAALTTPELAKISPITARRARAQAQEAVVEGIKCAPSLAAAVQMHSDCPIGPGTQREAVDRALLAAMAREAGLVERGMGDLEALKRSAKAVRLQELGDTEVSSLTRAARRDFYDVCARACSSASKDGVATSIKSGVGIMTSLIPGDWVVGQELVGQSAVTAAAVVELLLGAELLPAMQERLKTLMSEPSDSQAEEDALRELVAFARKHPEFCAGPQTAEALAQAYRVIFASSYRHSRGLKGTRGARMMKEIRQATPDDFTVEINDETKSPRDWMKELRKPRPGEDTEELPNDPLRGLLGSRVGSELLPLLAALARAPAASAEEAAALDTVLSYAHSHPSEGLPEAELVRSALVVIFRNSAASYLEDPEKNARCRTMMRQIADFLPSSTRTDLGGQDMTLTEHAATSRGLVAFKALQESPVGSLREREAATELIDALRSGASLGSSGEFQQRARLALANVSRLNAQPAGSPATRRIIDGYLGGSGLLATTGSDRPARGSKGISGAAVFVTVLVWGVIIAGVIWLVQWLWGALAGNPAGIVGQIAAAVFAVLAVLVLLGRLGTTMQKRR